MNMSNDFQDLLIWQKSHELSILIYGFTKHLPREELFGITSQIRRSAISVENNIAEGFGRRTKKDFANFLYMALGSLYETRSMLRVCHELEYISKELYHESDGKYVILSYMLKKFISSLESNFAHRT